MNSNELAEIAEQLKDLIQLMDLGQKINVDKVQLEPKQDYYPKYLAALRSAAEIVRNHEDVAHSYWWDINGDGSEFVCAKCGIPAGWMNPHIKKQDKSVFCPNCGAKMDGGNKHETD